MSITKNEIKLIRSLAQKKYRLREQLFVVEGIKGIVEFLDSDFELHQLYSTKDVFEIESVLISETELKRISSLKSPNTALAVFKIPEVPSIVNDGLIMALDDVRDPGNLGTIIRLCDWFGIEQLICSKATVDCFNQKVVQATMGSLTRVNLFYLDLDHFIENTTLPVFGTFMDGKNIYKEALPKEGIIVMGNEANGISNQIEKLVNHRIGIPRFGKLESTESLNVATAAAIVLSAFKA